MSLFSPVPSRMAQASLRAEAPDLAALRHRVAALARGEGSERGSFTLGDSMLDALPGGGLARGALHEIAGAEIAAGAPLGFALALACRAAGVGAPLVWVRARLPGGGGVAFGPGLAEFGLDPARLVLVRAETALAALRAAGEAARCAGLGAIILETGAEPRLIDLTATRRLALAVAETGVTLLFVRLLAEAGMALPASAAVTRWHVEPAPSRALPARAPGGPVFCARLTRHRGGVSERVFVVEWDRDRQAFRTALPGVVPALPARRAASPRPASPPLRRAG